MGLGVAALASMMGGAQTASADVPFDPTQSPNHAARIRAQGQERHLPA